MLPASPTSNLLLRCAALAVLSSMGALALAARADSPGPADLHRDAPASISQPATGTIGPRIAADAPVHDFGRVQQGQIIQHEFSIANTGDAVLEISDVKPSCGCTTAGAWTRSIKPGGNGTIPVQMDTAHYSSAIAKTITVRSNDPTHPTTVLEIKASIWAPISYSNPMVVFPALTDPRQVLSQSITIRNHMEEDIQLMDVASDQPAFRSELTEIVPGKEFKLTVTTVPPLETGTHKAHITIRSSSQKMPQLMVEAVATVLPPVQVFPTEIIMPVARLLSPEKHYVVLINHRGANLELSDVKTNAAGVEIATKATPDKKQITVMLTFPAGFQADAPGKRSVTGKTNHPDLPLFEVPIVYKGTH